jgi:hypothetical protein
LLAIPAAARALLDFIRACYLSDAIAIIADLAIGNVNDVITAIGASEAE